MKPNDRPVHFSMAAGAILAGAVLAGAVCILVAFGTGRASISGRSVAINPPEAPCAQPQVHFSPSENLEKIDVGVIDGATRSIDMAAFTLNDWPVIEALQRAAARGVTIRIIVDRGQLEVRPEAPPLIALQNMKDVKVELRVKRDRTLMHLKAYAVDGQRLRTGSANFSASGLKRQDNDLIVFECPALTARFEADFTGMWDKGGTE